MRFRLSVLLAAAAALLILAVGSGARAQSGQVIYDDALENGWQNYGWATLNYGNTSPVHSGSDSISVSAGAYQALYVHHTAFSSTPYASLTFWINGGTSGGQALQVQATLNGTAQTAYPIPTLAANTWRQVTIPLSALGVANSSSLDGFWIQNTGGGNLPTFYVDDASLTAVPPLPNPAVTINAAAAVGVLPPTGVGVNTAVWDGGLLDADVPGLLTQAGVTALRFPGGSTSDVYHWQTNSATAGTGQYINPADTFDAFIGVAQSAGAHPIITVNYGSNAAGNSGGDPNEAGAWVAYAKSKSYGVKYWEIGNEIYGNGEYGSAWEEDLHTDHSPTGYGDNVVLFANAMKAADSTIKVGAVLTAPGNWPDGQTPDWNSNVLAACGTSIDFVIVHWYAQSPGGESDSGLLASTSSIAGMVSKVRALIDQYCGANAPNVQIFVTETNSVSYNPGKQTVGLVNGLFAADDDMQWLESGVANVDWWDLHNGAATGNNNSASLYGSATFGDYGLLSSGQSPEPPTDTPFAPYYGLQMLTTLGKPGDTLVSASSNTPLLAAYAVKQVGGALALLLINKDPSNSDAVQVIVSGYTPTGHATAYFYGENSNAITSSTVTGGSGGSFTVTAPPYSLTTVVLAPATAPPTITVAASATPSLVTGITTQLSVQAHDPQGQALTYTWAGPASVSFSANGTAAAANTTAAFTAAGSYAVTATATDASGLSASSAVTVTVQQTPTRVTVTPTSATVLTGAAQQFTAAVTDQFGASIASPALAWAVSGGGTVSPAGTFTAAKTPGGPYALTAADGSAHGAATLTVAAPVNGAAFVSQSVPSSMTTGQSYPVSVTMRNTGTTTWTSAGAYHLGSQDPQDNTVWSLGRVYLPSGTASVAPGASVTFSFTVKAPATGGARPFQWRMVQDGVQWFGDYSPAVSVAVSGPPPVVPPVNAAAFVSQSVPSSMTAGGSYAVSVTMRNTGTTTWTSAWTYHLGSQDPQDNTTWGLGRVYLPSGTASVAPGASVTFSFTVKAPATGGARPFQWRMVQDGVQWFGGYTTVQNITVH